MEDFRFISPVELAREKVFKQAIETLEDELNIHKVDYVLFHRMEHPVIVINGDTFDKNKNVTARVVEMYYQIFAEENEFAN